MFSWKLWLPLKSDGNCGFRTQQTTVCGYYRVQEGTFFSNTPTLAVLEGMGFQDYR